ncbi:membrane protein insertase YidC [Bifidobacterium pullorum subsp. saeculare]|uniref:Membrane protein insertase YidC n=1 Tax=Bifidobacterium pullorum subsp. saeculare TaxID=78257 RepID=A0A939BA69_9BIFI|nr:membrane protein insertase YidC [Bifidobacterium pullorum]MBM6699561.1 membrane protein insertase YidC [Bifidobacterium pullorum subsp. saeculare]
MPMQDQFMLDQSFFGWLYKILTPLEWLMTQIMNLFHEFLKLLGMNPVGFSWVLSIVFLVLVVHACIFPLFYRQMKSMRKMQALQPKMQKIQNKYKGKTDQASKEAMSREMMKLYQDNHANPAGSCLPMLIQGPVFMCMFYVLSAIPYIARGKYDRGTLGAFDKATAQEFAQTTVFGVNVTDTFTTAGVTGKVVMGVFVALMCACMWFMQFNSMKRNMNQETLVGPAATTQKMMLWVFPIMYIFSGIMMPFAVLVYWLTNNIVNLLRSMWQIHEFPTPGSPAAKEKEERDHRKENARRAKAGLPSLEEEALVKAKEEAEQRAAQGYQRQQPQRKRKKKK